MSIVLYKLGIGNTLKWLGQRTMPILCVHMTLGDVLLYVWGSFDGNSYTMNIIDNNWLKIGLFGIYLVIILVWLAIDKYRAKIN